MSRLHSSLSFSAFSLFVSRRCPAQQNPKPRSVMGENVTYAVVSPNVINVRSRFLVYYFVHTDARLENFAVDEKELTVGILYHCDRIRRREMLKHLLWLVTRLKKN